MGNNGFLQGFNPISDRPEHIFMDIVAETITNSPPLIYEVVVYDILFDPDYFREKGKFEEWRNEEGKTFFGSQLLEAAPRNSIIGRIVTDKNAQSDKYLRIFYPLFSHITTPTKPGEHVLVLFKKGITSSGLIGYWMSREVVEEPVNDNNYTHSPRRIFGISNEISSESKERVNEIMTSFVNGGDVNENNQNLRNLPEQDGYNELYDKALATENQIDEPVPKWKRRPSDTTLEGSNNTLISLGFDRKQDSDAFIDKAKKEDYKKSGTIDVVAGRAPKTPSPGSPAETPTGYGTVENSRQNLENDKDARRQSRFYNTKEGNPDYIRDLSRLLISMKTQGDENFALSDKYASINIVGKTLTPETIDYDAFGVLKSNRVRIVARKDEDENINGDIRLIKEGVQDDDRATVYLLSDGTIACDGANHYVRVKPSGEIVIVKDGANPSYIKIAASGDITIENNTNVHINTPSAVIKSPDIKLGSDGSSEPLLLGNQWTDFMGRFFQALIQFGQTATGNMGAPIPQSVILAATLQSLQAAFLDSKVILSDISKTQKA